MSTHLGKTAFFLLIDQLRTQSIEYLVPVLRNDIFLDLALKKRETLITNSIERGVAQLGSAFVLTSNSHRFAYYGTDECLIVSKKKGSQPSLSRCLLPKERTGLRAAQNPPKPLLP